MNTTSFSTLFLIGTLLPGLTLAAPDSQTMAVANALLAGQPSAIVEKYQKLQRLLAFRDLARSKMHLGDNHAAIKILQQGLKALGAGYLEPYASDSTNLHLALAESNLAKGNTAAAAAGMDSVYAGRLSGYEIGTWRLFSGRASTRDTPSVVAARRLWIVEIAEQFRARWSQDVNPQVEVRCDVHVAILPSGEITARGIEGTCGNSDPEVLSMLLSFERVPVPSIPAAYVPDLTITLFPGPAPGSSG